MVLLEQRMKPGPPGTFPLSGCRLGALAWLLRLLKPQLHRRLYGSLCIETARLRHVLPELELRPTEEGIETMAAWYCDVA